MGRGGIARKFKFMDPGRSSKRVSVQVLVLVTNLNVTIRVGSPTRIGCLSPEHEVPSGDRSMVTAHDTRLNYNARQGRRA